MRNDPSPRGAGRSKSYGRSHGAPTECWTKRFARTPSCIYSGVYCLVSGGIVTGMFKKKKFV
jgi:hypothetical protein